MADVEWMFGDVDISGASSFAAFNPLRWTGALTFKTAVAGLEEVIKQEGSRPIDVKIPSGVSTRAQRFDSTQAAIEYIKSKSPEEIKARQEAANEEKRKELLRKDLEDKLAQVEEKTTILADAQVKVQETEAKEAEALAAAGQSKSETCAWMFGDAATGLIGFNELAHLNPLRWSGQRTFDKAKDELDALVKDTSADTTAAQRPILLNVSGAQTKYENAQEAIDFIMQSLGEFSAEASIAENNHLEAKEMVVDAELRLTEAKSAADAAQKAADDAGA